MHNKEHLDAIISYSITVRRSIVDMRTLKDFAQDSCVIIKLKDTIEMTHNKE